jgi:hypothetical protein
MSEELDLLKDVAARLQMAGIEYMLTGSMAMAIYSMPRMTRDIDLIVQVCSGDAGRIVDLFRGDFYIDEASVRQAVTTAGMFNIIHNESVIKVDLIVRKNEEYRIEEFSRRQPVDVEGVTVQVVAPEDLVLSKLVWTKRCGSEQQLRDVRQIIASRREIDGEYLARWARKLGVDGLLAKVRMP